MPDIKEWTLMFYFASDNPLAPSIVSQLKAIKDAGFHPDANVIAQFDPHVVNTPSHTFEVNLVNKIRACGASRVGFGANDPFVRNLVLDKLWGEKEDDIRNHVKEYVEKTANGASTKEKGIKYDPPKPPAMSDDLSPKEALSSFLTFCCKSYPARHYLLFILGHGMVVGNDSFLFDDNAAEHSLLLTELGEVLRTFKTDIQTPHQAGELELVAFHSCSMSALEVAYELEGTANYMMASQGPAFVGSWPYKQILIRVFNDLNSRLSDADIIGPDSSGDASLLRLVNRLQTSADPIAKYLHSKLQAETLAALAQHTSWTKPDDKLTSLIVSDLDDLLDSADMVQDLFYASVPMSAATTHLNGSRLAKSDLRRLNRFLLADACPQEIARYPRIDVKRMLSRIFYYCLYNSYDFQLAGYSFDLCLTDLRKVREASKPIQALTESLLAGLRDENSIAQELILLAHWDSQSFWQEDYADLYDFCFRLQARCRKTHPGIETMASTETLKRIYDACDAVTDILRRGSDKIKDKLIVRSAFAGPAFQYSHGLSIFFPWAEPVGSKLWDDQYERYEFNKATGWKDYLEEYFKLTRRSPHSEEVDPKEPVLESDSVTDDLLAVLEDIGAHVFNDEGQLGKPGPDSPMGKHGPDDPTGNSCDCPTVKNYPLFTKALNARSQNGKAVKIPFNRNFLEGFQIREDLAEEN